MRRHVPRPHAGSGATEKVHNFFRDTAATHLIDAGVDVSTAQERVESSNLWFSPHQVSTSFRHFGVGLVNDITLGQRHHVRQHMEPILQTHWQYAASTTPLAAGLRLHRLRPATPRNACWPRMNVMLCCRKCIDKIAVGEATRRAPMRNAGWPRENRDAWHPTLHLS